jgi:hypothetical protein
MLVPENGIVGNFGIELSENPTNEMVRRLIPLFEQEDRGGSF